jgi:hypothetical protein
MHSASTFNIQRVNLPEIYPHFGHALSKMFASCFGVRTHLKNIGVMGLHIISLPEEPTFLELALFEFCLCQPTKL